MAGLDEKWPVNDDEQKPLSSQLFGVFPQEKNDPSQSANPCDPNTSQFQDPFGTAMGSCESARKADAGLDTGETTMVPVDLTEMTDETAMRSVDVAEEVTRLEIFIQFGVHDIEPFFVRPCQ